MIADQRWELSTLECQFPHGERSEICRGLLAPVLLGKTEYAEDNYETPVSNVMNASMYPVLVHF